MATDAAGSTPDEDGTMATGCTVDEALDRSRRQCECALMPMVVITHMPRIAICRRPSGPAPLAEWHRYDLPRYLDHARAARHRGSPWLSQRSARVGLCPLRFRSHR